MIDLNDPRTRERVAADADVSLATLKRYLSGGDAACRPSSVRRIREAVEALNARDGAKRGGR